MQFEHQVWNASHLGGLKKEVNISCNVSLGGCKYSISLSVTDQEWEIIVKQEGKIIRYSYYNSNLFHKRSQIFIRAEKSFNSVSADVKQT